MTEHSHTITIAPDANGFRVTVEPSHPDHPARQFTDHREARGWAGGVRMVSGWRLVDDRQPGGRT